MNPLLVFTYFCVFTLVVYVVLSFWLVGRLTRRLSHFKQLTIEATSYLICTLPWTMETQHVLNEITDHLKCTPEEAEEIYILVLQQYPGIAPARKEIVHGSSKN